YADGDRLSWRFLHLADHLSGSRFPDLADGQENIAGLKACRLSSSTADEFTYQRTRSHQGETCFCHRIGRIGLHRDWAHVELACTLLTCFGFNCDVHRSARSEGVHQLPPRVIPGIDATAAYSKNAVASLKARLGGGGAGRRLTEHRCRLLTAHNAKHGIKKNGENEIGQRAGRNNGGAAPQGLVVKSLLSFCRREVFA